jgi:hypothetical protein
VTIERHFIRSATGIRAWERSETGTSIRQTHDA